MEPDQPYPTRRRRGLAGLAIAILLGCLFGGGAMAYGIRNWDRLAAIVRPSPPAPLAATSPPVAAPPAPVAAIPDPAIAEKVEQLDDRVAAIDDRARTASGNAERAEGLLVTFAARRVIDRGQPLGYLETLLRNHFGGVDPQAVAMVIAASQRPITLTRLQDGFAAIAPQLVAAPPRQSWWTGFRRELASLFVIRRADTAPVLPDDRRERARRALEIGQVEVALTEVARLPGAAGANDWVAVARRYVLVHNALDRIETAALLAPPPKPVELLAAPEPAEPSTANPPPAPASEP